MAIDQRAFIWLILGAILSLFANGRWIFPMAAWLSPVFLMRFSRTQKPAKGFLLISLATAITGIIAWKGAIPVQGAPYYTMMVMGALFGALLYLIDRLIATRMNGFASTLVFPCSSVALEYLHVATSPYGSNGSLALTQNNLPLLQVVSITGMWGIIFLVTWFAPFVNWIWERSTDFARIRAGACVFTGVLIAVVLFGSLRLSFFPPSAETIRIASVTSVLPDPGIPSTMDGWEAFRTASAEKQADILRLSRQATSSGAKIIVWHEGEVFVLKEDERSFVDKGRELARTENVVLGMAIATFTRGFPKELAENKIVWIDTTETVLFEYLKAIPTPTEQCKAGDGEVKLLNLRQSRIASTICFDLDFPAFIGKFGKAGVDIMISPANDWDAISRTHPQQTSFRALEQGFSLIRPNTSSGLSAAYDYQGRLLTSIDYARTSERILVADLPAKGVNTIYSVIGDLFAWLCVLSTLLAVGWAIILAQSANHSAFRLSWGRSGR
jgi:apolipoprotein N-acyltransferase